MTPILGLTEMTSAQPGKFELYNENLVRLEAQTVRVLSRTNSGPPISPGDGDNYIVDVASGDWSSFVVGSIAQWTLGQWVSYPSQAGQRVTILDEGILGYYNGSIWINIVTASIGLNDWLIFTTNTSVAKGDRIFVDLTSNPITVTLPVIATLGDTIEIADITDAAAITNDMTNNILTINNNGLKIEGFTQNVTSQIPGKVFKLTYSNAAYGWKLFK